MTDGVFVKTIANFTYDYIARMAEKGNSEQVYIKMEIKEEPLYAEALITESEEVVHSNNPLEEEIKDEEEVDLDLLKEEVIVGEPFCHLEEASGSHAGVLPSHDAVATSVSLVNVHPVQQEEFGCDRNIDKIDSCGPVETLTNSDKTFTEVEGSENAFVYRCEICSKDFKEADLLKEHMLVHSDLQLHNSVTDKSKLLAEAMILSRVNKYNCSICGGQFNKEESLISHMLIHNGGKFPRCEMCGKGFIDELRKNNHIVLKKCKMANRSESANLSYLNILPERSKADSSEALMMKLYKCDMCEKFFGDGYKLKMHIMRHSGVKPYECDTCGKKFNDKSHFNTHCRIHSGIKPYKCTTCGKTFSDSSCFRRHSQSHDGIKPYTCETCGKSFSDGVYFNRHLQCHTNINFYKCGICGKNFAVKSHLRKHMLCHSGVKEYECDLCGKGFNNKTYLKHHIFSHSGIKPFECELCTKSFSYGSSYKRHILSHSFTKLCKAKT